MEKNKFLSNLCINIAVVAMFFCVWYGMQLIDAVMGDKVVGTIFVITLVIGLGYVIAIIQGIRKSKMLCNRVKRVFIRLITVVVILELLMTGLAIAHFDKAFFICSAATFTYMIIDAGHIKTEDGQSVCSNSKLMLGMRLAVVFYDIIVALLLINYTYV